MLYANSYEDACRYGFYEFPKMPYLIIGHTGIGKTAIPYGFYLKAKRYYEDCVNTSEADRTAAQKAEVEKGPIGFLNMNFSHLDYAELGGLPVNKGDHMEYLPPLWLKLMSMFKRGVAVFNEVNRMELQCRHAYMQLLDEREINGAKIPADWLIVQTANPSDDEYQVSEFDRALVRRSCVMHMADDTQVWQKWGMTEYQDPKTGESIDPAVLALSVRLGAQMGSQTIENRVEARPTRAGLTIVSEMRRAGLVKLTRDVRENIVAGVIGANGAGILEAMLSGDLIQRLMAKFEKGESITGVDDEVMFDLMFMAVDKVKKEPKKWATQIHRLFLDLPEDAKPVLAAKCYPWFHQFKKEFMEMHLSYRKWLTEHAETAMRFSLPDDKVDE
jgi:hypothetical protein